RRDRRGHHLDRHLRAPVPLPGARSAPERIRRGGLRLRRDPAGDPVAPHPAQLRRPCDRARRAAAGIGDPADLHPRLPRLRRPAAHPRMGLLISEGRDYVATAWWLTLLPGLVVAAVVLSTNRLSNAIGEAERS